MKTIKRSEFEIVHSIPPKFDKSIKVAIDTEISNIPNGKLHRPVGDFVCATFFAGGDIVYMVTDTKDMQQAMDNCNDATTVMANAIFDIRQIRRWANVPDRKKLVDILLIEKIMFSGFYDQFALNDLFRRYCGGYLDKEQQKSFIEFSGQMSEEQEFYAAADAVATWEVWNEQKKIVSDTDYNIWKNIELPAMWSIISFRGAYIDQNRWTEIALSKEEIAQELWDEINKEYGINVNSAKNQLQPLLEELLGHKLKKGTGVSELKKLIGKHPLVQKILDYRKPKKGASTYGMKWLDDVEEDGRVYSSINQIGATTARHSSSSPNLQNIPVRDNPEYRECFIAAPGNVVIIADWSSQEPRIAGWFSNDQKLIATFYTGKDIYVGMGKDVLGMEFEKSNPLRKKVKKTFLGLCYGETPFGIARDLEVEKEEAEELVTKFFKAYPGLKKYTDDMVKSAKNNEYVTTISGRKCWISPYSYNLEMTAPNYPIQSSAGDAMKLAEAHLYQYWMKKYGYNCIVLPIHDELLIEVPAELAEEAMTVMKKIMIEDAESLHVGIKADADVFMGKSWSEKQ
jgi:DNA polymerase I-like protein with 3'-5' exonuclease and polymerase domains